MRRQREKKKLTSDITVRILRIIKGFFTKCFSNLLNDPQRVIESNYIEYNPITSYYWLVYTIQILNQEINNITNVLYCGY